MGWWTRPVVDPFDEKYWRKVGAEGGRRNEPREPDGPAAARTQLEAVWKAELHAARKEFLATLDALNTGRMDHHRVLHDLAAQAATDPRQATALSGLKAREQGFAAERELICQQFAEAVAEVTQQAGAADAIWRAANERHRDRRISIVATDLVIPAEVLEIPADPFA